MKFSILVNEGPATITAAQHTSRIVNSWILKFRRRIILCTSKHVVGASIRVQGHRVKLRDIVIVVPVYKCWIGSSGNVGCIVDTAIVAEDDLLTPRFVERAKQLGYGLGVWTVNLEGRKEELRRWGVDVLITDTPGGTAPLTDRASAR